MGCLQAWSTLSDSTHIIGHGGMRISFHRNENIALLAHIGTSGEPIVRLSSAKSSLGEKLLALVGWMGRRFSAREEVTLVFGDVFFRN